MRPHEALGDATPASRYTPSTRPYPAQLPALEYPGHYEVRRLSRNGGMRWHKQWVNVSQTLGEEYVGLVEIDDGEWDVYFGPCAWADSTSAPSRSISWTIHAASMPTSTSRKLHCGGHEGLLDGRAIPGSRDLRGRREMPLPSRAPEPPAPRARAQPEDLPPTTPAEAASPPSAPRGGLVGCARASGVAA